MKDVSAAKGDSSEDTDPAAGRMGCAMLLKVCPHICSSPRRKGLFRVVVIHTSQPRMSGKVLARSSPLQPALYLQKHLKKKRFSPKEIWSTAED